MLQRIRLKEFKSFVDAEVSLSPLTLLVGPNASGKSNLLDAIRFLKGAAMGMTFDEVLARSGRGGAATWPGIRGGATEVAHNGAREFELQTTWLARDPFTHSVNGVDEPRKSTALSHEITCRINSGIHTSRERILAGQQELVRTDGTHMTLFGEESASLSSSASSVLGQLPTGFSIQMQTSWLEHAMRDVAFLELRPDAMRGWGNIHAPFGVEGENFAGRLADFIKDDTTRQTVVDRLRELCAPEIEDLAFIRNDELGEVMLMLVERGGRRISARSISDGTLRFLGLFVALNAIEPGPVVVVEEIDTGLHPTRLRVVVELLEQVTRERGVQVIATTHSPALLEWLSPERLRDVIAFGRTPDHPGTVMRRLGDIERFEEVVAHDRIDELFGTGWLETAL